MRGTVAVGAMWLGLGVLIAAQGSGQRPPSPAGSSATEIGGQYVPGKSGSTYRGGKWIEITYGRPIKRGRDLWGSGADYGKMLLDTAPVWRAGANLTTRLKTEVPLVFNGTNVPVGEYSVLIDLKPNAWTLIVSSWPAHTRYEPQSPEYKNALYGAFNYTPDKDVVRAPMTLGTLPFSVDQLTWNFVDMSNAGGKLAIMWDKVVASSEFKIGQ